MKSLKKAWAWFDDRTGIGELVAPMLTHPAPPGAKWWYVFGTATLTCLIIQVITGISLAMLYQPSSGTAYASLQYIDNKVPLGGILRGIHYWGASAMILFMAIHMIRVYIFAAYKFPREMSWITGVVLLGLTLGMGFTGQLLRFDDNAIWTIVVGAEQASRSPVFGTFLARFLLGGQTVGGQTLSRFFDFHVFILPALLFGVLGLHLFLVLRNGISEPPKAGRPVDPKTYRKWYESMLKKEGVPFFPDAAWRDITFSVAVLAAIVLFAVYIGPPALGGPPDPSSIEVMPLPDWYLVWADSIFALSPPAMESYVIILGPLFTALILFSVPFLANKGERHPIKRPWAVAGAATVVVIVTSLLILGEITPWAPAFDTKPLPVSLVADDGPAAQRGQQLFLQEGCQYCHEIRGQGGGHGPNLTYIGDKMTAQQLTIQIVNGGGAMPAFGGTLTTQQLHDLVAFLQTRTRNHDARLRLEHLDP